MKSEPLSLRESILEILAYVIDCEQEELPLYPHNAEKILKPFYKAMKKNGIEDISEIQIPEVKNEKTFRT